MPTFRVITSGKDNEHEIYEMKQTRTDYQKKGDILCSSLKGKQLLTF
jgi:hypothetical protein